MNKEETCGNCHYFEEGKNEWGERIPKGLGLCKLHGRLTGADVVGWFIGCNDWIKSGEKVPMP